MPRLASRLPLKRTGKISRIRPTWVMARAWVPRDALGRSPRRLAGRRGRIGFTVRPLRQGTCYGRVVQLRQLSTLCSHNAVVFGDRPVNGRPDGDFHPAERTPSQAQ